MSICLRPNDRPTPSSSLADARDSACAPDFARVFHLAAVAIASSGRASAPRGCRPSSASTGRLGASSGPQTSVSPNSTQLCATSTPSAGTKTPNSNCIYNSASASIDFVTVIDFTFRISVDLPGYLPPARLVLRQARLNWH